MTISLTNEEKINIVNQHIRSVEYSIYGYELDLIEANALSTPDASQIASINSKMSEATARRTALVAEKDSLSISEEE